MMLTVLLGAAAVLAGWLLWPVSRTGRERLEAHLRPPRQRGRQLRVREYAGTGTRPHHRSRLAGRQDRQFPDHARAAVHGDRYAWAGAPGAPDGLRPASGDSLLHVAGGRYRLAAMWQGRARAWRDWTGRWRDRAGAWRDQGDFWYERMTAAIEGRLAHAGLFLDARSAVLLGAGAIAGGGIAGTALRGPEGGAAGVVAATMLIPWWLRERRRRRMERFDEQLPEALSMLVQHLRAGHTVQEGLGSVGVRFPPPLGPVFDHCCRQVRLGVPLEEALVAMRREAPSEGVALTTAALRMALRGGGEVSVTLEAQIAALRAHVAFRRQLRALTAQVRLSAWMVGALPLVVSGGLVLLSPAFFAPMIEERAGRMLLAIGLGLQALGIQVIRRLLGRMG
ncbi:MAG: type II secretion system F family protein [Armatimonadetes bacterium]|nr:type II secretion system F family protein [Armatimonadota bacterium]